MMTVKPRAGPQEARAAVQVVRYLIETVRLDGGAARPAGGTILHDAAAQGCLKACRSSLAHPAQPCPAPWLRTSIARGGVQSGPTL